MIDNYETKDVVTCKCKCKMEAETVTTNEKGASGTFVCKSCGRKKHVELKAKKAKAKEK